MFLPHLSIMKVDNISYQHHSESYIISEKSLNRAEPKLLNFKTSSHLILSIAAVLIFEFESMEIFPT